jgi:hypothetical protein
MTNDELLTRVEQLAGPQRAPSFRMAVEFLLRQTFPNIVETGCYRGNPADGQSTLIWAETIRHIGRGAFSSFDNNEEHCKGARKLLIEHGIYHEGQVVPVYHEDSILGLRYPVPPISLVYLDSYDHDENDAAPCQRHQLAEVGAVLGAMQTPGAILLDDCDFKSGGKCGMSAPFLESRGWKLAYAGYQRLYLNA